MTRFQRWVAISDLRRKVSLPVSSIDKSWLSPENCCQAQTGYYTKVGTTLAWEGLALSLRGWDFFCHLCHQFPPNYLPPLIISELNCSSCSHVRIHPMSLSQIFVWWNFGLNVLSAYHCRKPLNTHMAHVTKLLLGLSWVRNSIKERDKLAQVHCL